MGVPIKGVFDHVGTFVYFVMKRLSVEEDLNAGAAVMDEKAMARRQLVGSVLMFAVIVFSLRVGKKKEINLMIDYLIKPLIIIFVPCPWLIGNF